MRPIRRLTRQEPPVELLFVGRAEARKGFDCLMAAVEVLAAELSGEDGPAFHLSLVGISEADLPELSNGARSHVTLLGRLDDAELDDAYRAADIVVAPSRYESFGLVYQEALAFGRPVVALSVDPSARQVIGESGAGLLAAEASGAALAAVLARAIRDPELCRTFHERALAAAGRFTRKSLAAETLALYEAARAFSSQGR
ncbi:glycosyltransferase family 4 protein [Jiella pelagia]|uniref:glycosyltransferase family 4 protein n=1 Tax=Jiella pelagia TaxID=2986949 RepID=UPI002E33DE11|nr:glycosyltransferase family 4 protein [Jiella pelagia]